MARHARFTAAVIVPFVPPLLSLGIAIQRFRVRDQLGGLALGMSGFVLMVVLAVWLDRRGA
jgi:hypothetical protein